MDDFDAPATPPPPKVPEGWVARWNEQYKEWFYVNTFTKKSQWEKPTAPARPPEDESPVGPPPSYTPGDKPAPTDTKKNPYDDHNKDTTGARSSAHDDEDAKLARQLQAEEDAKARTHSPAGGAAASYANTPYTPDVNSPGNPYPNQLPPRPDSSTDKAKGLLGKFFGSKNKHGSSSGSGGGFPGIGQFGGSHGHGAPAYGGYPPPQGYGAYPPPQPGYGGYGAPPGGYYGGGYPQQAYGRPHKSGGGMGAAGGAALGLGAGLLGGALIAEAFDDDHDGGDFGDVGDF